MIVPLGGILKIFAAEITSMEGHTSTKKPGSMGKVENKKDLQKVQMLMTPTFDRSVKHHVH